MANTLVFNLSVFAALLPAAVVAFRSLARPGLTFWSVTLVACTGPLVWVVSQNAGGWQPGLSAALWTIVAASMIVFVITCKITPPACRLSPILTPYLAVLGLFAVLSVNVVPTSGLAGAASAWFYVHVFFAVFAYALATVAAIAAAAVLWHEWNLKRRRHSVLSGLLPSLVDAGWLQIRLLIAVECMLAAGAASGMAAQFMSSGQFLTLNHKTVLALCAFAFVGAFLAAYYSRGMGGRKTAGVVLGCYLLLTLAYPGVKFIADVLEAS